MTPVAAQFDLGLNVRGDLASRALGLHQSLAAVARFLAMTRA